MPRPGHAWLWPGQMVAGRALSGHPCPGPWRRRSWETMTGTDDHILTRWELEASPQEVFDLIADAPSYSRWWPSVFLESRVLEPGDERRAGRLVEVRTATFLLASVRWRYRVTAAHAPGRLAVETSGDLEGLGLWTFEARGRNTVVRFNWRGRVTRTPFRQLPTFLRPLTRACHRWAMERGFTSLLLEVWRRRTDDHEARDWLPRPPGPAFPRNLRPRPAERIRAPAPRPGPPGGLSRSGAAARRIGSAGPGPGSPRCGWLRSPPSRTPRSWRCRSEARFSKGMIALAPANRRTPCSRKNSAPTSSLVPSAVAVAVVGRGHDPEAGADVGRDVAVEGDPGAFHPEEAGVVLGALEEDAETPGCAPRSSTRSTRPRGATPTPRMKSPSPAFFLKGTVSWSVMVVDALPLLDRLAIEDRAHQPGHDDVGLVEAARGESGHVDRSVRSVARAPRGTSGPSSAAGRSGTRRRARRRGPRPGSWPRSRPGERRRGARSR